MNIQGKGCMVREGFLEEVVLQKTLALGTAHVNTPWKKEGRGHDKLKELKCICRARIREYFDFLLFILRQRHLDLDFTSASCSKLFNLGR